jgi:AraC-like DNA-binding protein
MMVLRRLDSSTIKESRFWTQSQNRITFSSLNEAEIDNYKADTYSIKYVLDGTEHYKLGGRNVRVSAGNFLLVNAKREISFHLKSTRPVVGYCIHLEETLISDTFNSLTRSVEWLLDNETLKGSDINFNELLYSQQENELGPLIDKFRNSLKVPLVESKSTDDTFFYELAAGIVRMQYNSLQGGNVNTLRASTRNELLRRLHMAKEMMMSDCTTITDIATYANLAMLSPSHFYRNFKKAFGVTPYQFLLKSRIEKAMQLFSSKKIQATEVAHECGFADLAAFSKAFKKITGHSPGSFSLSKI